jgi:hypothetical protein
VPAKEDHEDENAALIAKMMQEEADAQEAAKLSE